MQAGAEFTEPGPLFPQLLQLCRSIARAFNPKPNHRSEPAWESSVSVAGVLPQAGLAWYAKAVWVSDLSLGTNISLVAANPVLLPTVFLTAIQRNTDGSGDGPFSIPQRGAGADRRADMPSVAAGLFLTSKGFCCQSGGTRESATQKLNEG